MEGKGVKGGEEENKTIHDVAATTELGWGRAAGGTREGGRVPRGPAGRQEGSGGGGFARPADDAVLACQQPLDRPVEKRTDWRGKTTQTDQAEGQIGNSKGGAATSNRKPRWLMQKASA